MFRQYRAFLLCCWQRGDGDQRFEIAHIESADVLRAITLADVIDWIGVRLATGYVPESARREADRSTTRPLGGRG